jgi:hypothetical protein
MGQLVGPHEGAPGSKTLGAMTILWSPEAIEDLTSLRAYIANDIRRAELSDSETSMTVANDLACRCSFISAR